MAGEISARFGLPYLAAGQAQKEIVHNEALALIDAALAPVALGAEIDDPIEDPTIGGCWIVGSAPTGVWTGDAGSLACWTSGGWRFLPAVDGLRVWLADQDLWTEHRAGAWIIGDVVGQRLITGGQQVVGTRGAAVIAPSGGVTVDVEARDTLNVLISRLVAHGMIAA